jgi:hypothetical protein
VLLTAFAAYGQKGLNDVRLFQSFFEDAPIIKSNYVQGAFSYSGYDGFSQMTFGAMGGHPVNKQIDVQGALGFMSWSPEEGDGESGLTDLAVYGKYNITQDKNKAFSAGGMITLPIGKEEIGQGNLNFGGFGAFRTALSSGLVLTANAGLVFYETTTVEFDEETWEMEEKTERDNYLRIGGGVIYPMKNKKTSLVGELVMLTEFDYMMLSGGLDHVMKSGARLRGALGIGMDDGAPDIMIQAGYLFTLK